jgi:hypothetical protein
VDDAWETGRAAVMLHVLLNEMGVVAAAARTLLERWADLQESDRDRLLRMIDDSVVRGIGELHSLAFATGA